MGKRRKRRQQRASFTDFDLKDDRNGADTAVARARRDRVDLTALRFSAVTLRNGGKIIRIAARSRVSERGRRRGRYACRTNRYGDRTRGVRAQSDRVKKK